MTRMRLCQVSTDDDGKLVSPPDLPKNAVFELCHDVDPPFDIPHPTREKVVEWIDECVIGDLRTVLLGMQTHFDKRTALSSGPPHGGGNFLLMVNCCMVIEFLGKVYDKGANGTLRARRYVADFLHPREPRYLEFFETIWGSFRNGIVHGSWPMTLCIKGDEENRLVPGVSTSGAGEHFVLIKDEKRPVFLVNSVKLLSDLIDSIEPFKLWIMNEADDGVRWRASAFLWVVPKGNRDVVPQIAKIKGGLL